MSHAGRALIGHRGFVGSNLAAARKFDDYFGSADIGAIGEREYELVVCAAPGAEKWRANRFPEEDAQMVGHLVEALRPVRTQRFVLISSIDVYARKKDCWDDSDEYEQNQAYGKHRRELECFVENTFESSFIVRLPGLFGTGLKKNLVFDLLHDHQLELINPASSFQFYDLRRLADDIDRILELKIRSLLLATEPVYVRDIVSSYFPEKKIGSRPNPEAHYDVRSRSAQILGGKDGYLLSAQQVMSGLGSFIDGYRHAT